MSLCRIIRATAAFAKPWEGLRLQAYDDADGHVLKPGETAKGTASIGYGHIDGVEAGDTCTEEEAEWWLEDDLEQAAAGLDRAWKPWRDLPQDRAVALLDAAFNLGAAFATAKHSLGQALRGIGSLSVPDALRLYVNAGGVRLAGLAKRREAEVKLWSKNEEEIA
jgi:lysozyme